MTDEPVAFGAVLRQLRTAAALSQEALAERAAMAVDNSPFAVLPAEDVGVRSVYVALSPPEVSRVLCSNATV